MEANESPDSSSNHEAVAIGRVATNTDNSVEQIYNPISGQIEKTPIPTSVNAPSGQANPADMIEGSEHVLVVVRKHWAGIALIYLCATMLILSLIVIAAVVLPDLKLSSQTAVLSVVAGLAVLTLFGGILAAMIYVYHRSKLTLTDRSLVQVLQRSLFNCKTSRLSMSNVEDVNVEQKGIIASMLNFGTLTVQTAGEEDNFVFSFCPTPNIYAERILEARQAYAQHHTAE